MISFLRALPRPATLAALAATFAAAPLPAAPAAPARPNLLVIQTDEHNFRTLGAYRALLPPDQAFPWGPGIAVETPHLDWLARHGAIADRTYATSPVCTPSRASFVSGRYPQNTGAIQNDLPLRDDIVTFAEELRRAGYATGYAGKWHLDGDGKPQFGPERNFGFTDNRYMFNRGHWKNLAEDARGPRVGTTDARGNPNYNVGDADAKSFTTDFLTDRALAFIRAHRDRPFCYMLSIPDPHGPNTVRAPYDTMYLGLKFQPPRSARSPGSALPGYAATLAGAFNQVQMARYFGMVKCIDDNVGRLLARLRELGLLERTVIVFTSDHGDLCGEHGRDNKGVPMEGSARIPLLVYAPGIVPAGTVVREALGTVDFKPTVLSLLGVPAAAGGPVEGRDASALFRTGRAPADWDEVTFVRIGGGARRAAAAEDGEGGGAGWLGAFTRRHKFIVAPNAAPALFDLEQDPDELTNLLASPAHRPIVRTLAGRLADYARRHGDPHLQSPRVQADLAWAVSDSPTYTPAAADTAKSGANADRRANRKGKAKKQVSAAP
jgi:arylsulfatase A-like enzyme